MAFESRDPIEDIWGPRTPYLHEWPHREDKSIEEEPDKWVQSACFLCSNGCGLDIGVKQGRVVGVRGRVTDRVNKGRLGPKGLKGWASINHPDRLTHPLVRKNGQLVQISWDEAMSLVVEKAQDIRRRMTGHAIAFYTSGQLFLEEYYALAVIGKAGLNTLNMDGDTRLCSATAAASLRESFGSDGQPASYSDIDCTHCLFLVGHNMASTQTVLWSRILDRLDGPKPPKLVVVDPRKTQTAKRADVHLAPKVGTNVALLNGIQCLLFQNGWVNDEWVSQHTCGVEGLKKTVEKYTPDVVEKITGVPSKDLEEAARIIGTSKALVSTALQGVYQSNQATAAACQINNVNLLRGLIGKPGSGVFQMNSQPTAQNNREAGCNCEFPAFRNHKNPVHMQQLADLWNIEYRNLPHWAEPTPIMTLLDYMEKGSVEMLWVSGTNPLVSLPDLPRIREIFSSPHLFLVCQDIFLTETAAIANVVIPAAQWGEKIGTYTNADRTVHLSEKAVDPPGQARSDLDVFLDFGNRMALKDKDGNDLLPWRTAEEVFEAWKLVSKGRPCDYSGLTYDKLRGGSGIQWPCNEQYPLGKERLFEDGIFNTDIDYCESFGHDLETGVPFAKDQYLELNPRGRAILKWSPYVPPIETPDEKYPLLLNTGREALHSDTHEKTGRSKPLQDSCPEPRVQISESDAARFDVKDGEMVLVRSRRGVVEMPVSIGDIIPGQAFIPFHFGYFDSTDGRARAANELTIDQWDPVSKQPTVKGGTVRIEKLPQDATDTGQVKIHAREQQSDTVHRVENSKREAHTVPNEIKNTNQRTCRLETWLAFTVQAATDLFEICEQQFDCSFLVSDKDIYQGFRVLSHIAMTIHDLIQPFAKKYSVREMPRESISRRLRATLFPYNLSTYEAMNERADVLIVLRRLYVPGCHVEMQLVGLQAASEAMGDKEFQDAVLEAQKSIRRILEWMRYVMSIKVPQLLLVPIRD